MNKNKLGPGGSDGKESICNVRDFSSFPGLGGFPGGGHGNPLQKTCLENPHGQRCLVGYSPWGHKELDTTQQLRTHTFLEKQWGRQGTKRSLEKAETKRSTKERTRDHRKSLDFILGLFFKVMNLNPMHLYNKAHFKIT